MVRSAPPQNAFLFVVSSLFLLFALAMTLSRIAVSSAVVSDVMTFIDRPGISQVTSAMPSASTSNLKLAMLHPLDDRRGAHAGADAERNQRRLLAGALQFVEHGAEDHRAGRP